MSSIFGSAPRRTVFGVVATVLLSVVLLSAYLQGHYSRELRASLQQDAEVRAQLLADEADRYLPSADRSELQAVVSRQARLLGARVTVLSADGQVLADSEQGAGSEGQAQLPEVRQAVREGLGRSVRGGETPGRDVLYVAARYPAQGEARGVVRVALPLDAVESAEAEAGRVAGLIILAAGLAAALVGLVLARASAEFVGPITRMARRLARGEPADRIRIDSADEVGDLARALNELADRLRSTAGDVSEERNTLAAVLANMDDGIVILGSDGRVTLANPAAERILQLPEGQARGRTSIEALRDHELARLVRDCVGGGGAGNCTRTMEVGLPRRYLRVQATPLGEGRGLVVLQDLTELRRADTIRRDFIANVSHELRTPLASLKALVETLQDGALDDPPAAREFVERMGVEVEGMTQLVRGLLELSRIEAGQVALRIEEVDVREMLLQTAERLRPQAERAGLELTVDAAADLPPAPVDRERVQQALINLIHNAVKFTPPGGRVRVLGQGARIRLDGSFELLHSETAGPVPTHVVLTVADTGVGIAAEDQPRIFERFYKADKARSGGGTGLGLAIAKHVAEAHDGRIWVESVEGEGATFRLALPVGRRTRDRTAREAPEAARRLAGSA